MDIARVRRALAALDALAARFPWLTKGPERARLAKALDGAGKEGDRGRTRDGDEEDQG